MTPSSKLVVWFSLYKWRMPLVTSAAGFPDTKLIWSGASDSAALTPLAGVESLVERLEESLLEWLVLRESPEISGLIIVDVAIK